MMTVSHPNQLKEIIDRMKTPVYWIADCACGVDHQAWTLMLSDGRSGQRVSISETLFAYLSYAFKWLEDNSMPIDGIDIVVQPKLNRARKTKMDIEWLSSESNHVLVIEGHVDLEEATSAIRREGGEEFPPAKHVFMRYTDVPEGEEGNWWREVCTAEAKGAEPVTMSVIQH